MDYIEIANPNSREVKQFHDVLVDAFPAPCEREDMELLRRNLRQGSWTDRDEICRYHLIVAREGELVVGGVSFYFYGNVGNAMGMGSYLAVKNGFRGEGIGTELIGLRDRTLSSDALELDCRLKGLIIQVSDPELMDATEIERDVMDPSKRERFWKRRGYRKIDFDFIQPPIREGESSIECLSLYMFPYCSEWEGMERMSRVELGDIIRCFIKCTGTPEIDPSYLRMKSELLALEYFPVV